MIETLEGSYLCLRVQSSHGGLEVEQWSDNRLLSASVDQIPIEAIDELIILNRKVFISASWMPMDVCYNRIL